MSVPLRGDRAGEMQARLAGTIWRASVDPAGQLEDLRALVEEARPAIERGGGPAARAALEHAAGYLDFFRGRNAAALAAFMRAMEHARQAGDLWFETSMRPMAATCIQLGPTPVSEALRWLDAMQAHSTTYQPELDVRRASMLAEVGRVDEARSLLSETLAQMNERGLALYAAHSTQTAWRIEMLAGDDVAAERMARQGCEQLHRLGERSVLSTQACQLAEALYALGRYEESRQWSLRGLELGSSDDLATQVYGLGVRSKLLARTADIGAALALAEQVDGLAKTSDDPRDQGYTLLNLAEILYLTGDPTRAEEMTRRSIEHYQRKGATAYVARAKRLAAKWAAGSPTASAVTQARQGTAGSGHAHPAT